METKAILLIFSAIIFVGLVVYFLAKFKKSEKVYRPLNDGSGKPPVLASPPAKGGEVHLDLPSGRKAVIYGGEAIHAIKADQIIGSGDRTYYMNALMSQLVTIDEKYLVLEDFNRIPLNDYYMIKTEFANRNF